MNRLKWIFTRKINRRRNWEGGRKGARLDIDSRPTLLVDADNGGMLFRTLVP